MPSASEFSTNPDSNVTIGGINVGEGCSPAGLNNVVRYLAAVARDTYNSTPNTGVFMPFTGGTFSGDIFRLGRGAYLHHSGSGQADGRVYTLPEGSPRPTAAEGMYVFYYS